MFEKSYFFESYFSNRALRSLSHYWENCCLWVRSEQLPTFVNKVLLGHKHAQLSTYQLWLLSCYNGRADSSSKAEDPHGSQSLEYFLSSPLEKNVCQLLIMRAMKLNLGFWTSSLIKWRKELK